MGQFNVTEWRWMLNGAVALASDSCWWLAALMTCCWESARARVHSSSGGGEGAAAVVRARVNYLANGYNLLRPRRGGEPLNIICSE